jgi:ABC-2 type transport system ATP-binding protein
MTGRGSIVVVADARHAFAGRRVLDGVDLVLKAGEIYCLLGANGAGKTTLMHAITGRLALGSGRVTIDGRDPRGDARARERVGFVPQDIALYPHLTVTENLRVFGRLAGVSRAQLGSRIATAMLRAGLGERAGQITSTLSGGYQRRVNICASILHDPVALVLDEPTVGIDVDARDAVHRMLLGLKSRGTAIMMTTHDLEQAQELADRVGILHNGRIVMEGAPDALLRDVLGEHKEVVLTLAKAPDDSLAAALAAMGFAQARGPHEWMARMLPEQLSAGWLGAQLTQAGLRVKEIRVHDPDLSSLFKQVVGEGRAT